MSCMILSNK